jgi:hypothetical protein
MVDPKSKDVVGIHIEALERKFLTRHPLLKKSWPYVKQTLSEKLTSNSLLQLFSFGLAFLLQENERELLLAA